MHRRKLRKYAILKDIFGLLGGTALLAMIGIVGGYETGTMDALMFLMELVIAVETMAVRSEEHTSGLQSLSLP